jgi:hypothetical protein
VAGVAAGFASRSATPAVAAAAEPAVCVTAACASAGEGATAAVAAAAAAATATATATPRSGRSVATTRSAADSTPCTVVARGESAFVGYRSGSDSDSDSDDSLNSTIAGDFVDPSTPMPTQASDDKAALLAAERQALVSAQLVTQLHALCNREFAAGELEALDGWLARIARDGGGGCDNGALRATTEYAFLVVQHPDDGRVVAGASLELYAASRCGVLGYVVVDACCRGKGIVNEIVARAEEQLRAMASQKWGSRDTLAQIFIDVAQAGDGGDASGFAATRQKIWTKLQFAPLPGDLVHPGAMAHGRYQLAVYTPLARATAGGVDAPVTVPLETTKRFIRDYFAECLGSAPHGADAAVACEPAAAALLAQVELAAVNGLVPASPSLWK